MMRKLLFVCGVLIFSRQLWADSKLTALTKDTTAQATDLIYKVDDPSGTPTSRSIALSNLLSQVAVSSLSATGVTSGSYGSATQVPGYTVGADGRLTAASNTTISLGSANLPANISYKDVNEAITAPKVHTSSEQWTSALTSSFTYGVSMGSAVITNLGPGVLHSVINSSAITSGLVAMGTEMSGTMQAAQMPALVGNVSNSAGSLSTTVNTVPQGAMQAGSTNYINNSNTPITGSTAAVSFIYASSSGTILVLAGSTITLGTPLSLSNAPINAQQSANGPVQINIQNTSNGSLASSDFIATNDLGTNTSFYLDVGINSSTNSDVNFNVMKASDSYMYAANRSLMIGTAENVAGSSVCFFTGGTSTGNVRMGITNTGTIFLTGLSSGVVHVLANSSSTAVSPVALASEVSGTLQATNFPALIGNVSNAAGALSTTVNTCPAGAMQPGSTNYAQITASLQAGSTVYLATGTIMNLNASTVTIQPINNTEAFTLYNATHTKVITMDTSLTGLTSSFVVLDSTGRAVFVVNGAGHIVSQSTQPIISSCGTTPVLSTNSNDFAGTVTTGATATGCTITFANPMQNKPTCHVTNQSMSITSAMTYTTSTTALTVSQAVGLAGDLLDWTCIDH